MLLSPDFRSLCDRSATTGTADPKKGQMVMILPICYKENTLISLRFRQKTANPGHLLAIFPRLKKTPGMRSIRAFLFGSISRQYWGYKPPA
jgi:hypothetical protein